MSCKCTSCKCGKESTERLIEQIEDQTKPFREEVVSSQLVLRHFDPAAPNHLFKWHADHEDRWITSTAKNDWKFQFDNQLPQHIEPDTVIHIPLGIIHRLIKGKSSLTICIKS